MLSIVGMVGTNLVWAVGSIRPSIPQKAGPCGVSPKRAVEEGGRVICFGPEEIPCRSPS